MLFPALVGPAVSSRRCLGWLCPGAAGPGPPSDLIHDERELPEGPGCAPTRRGRRRGNPPWTRPRGDLLVLGNLGTVPSLKAGTWRTSTALPGKGPVLDLSSAPSSAPSSPRPCPVLALSRPRLGPVLARPAACLRAQCESCCRLAIRDLQ